MHEKLSDILSKYGLNPNSISKIKLGSGVVGSLTHLGLAAFTLLTVACYKLDNNLFIIGCAILGIITYVWTTNKITKFAKNHPDQAMLGGAEFFAIRQHQLASKELKNPQESVSVSNPYESDKAFLTDVTPKKGESK